MPVLKLLTCNILVDKPNSPHPWNERRELLAEMLRREGSDVLCIQEALQHQKEFLLENLPGYDVFGVGRNDGKTDGEQVAVFHRTDRLRELDRGVFWLSERPDLAGSIGWDAKRPRIVCWKKLQPLDGKPFYVLTTHYDHVGREARRRSAQVIAGQIQGWEKAPVLLCGDFNSPAVSEPYRCLLEQGFSDGFTAAEGDFPYTYHRFQAELYTDEAQRKKIMAEHDRVFRRIDHIFFRGEVRVSGVRVVGVQRDRAYPSDHFPLSGEFEIL